MTVMEWQARNIEAVAHVLAHWVETTRPDRLDWCPKTEDASDTRSVLAQIQECVQANRSMAALLKGQAPGSPEPAAITSAAEARQQLQASARELAGAVRGLSEADLDRPFETRYGPMPGSRIILLPMQNMIYHGGQINLMQRLYGDLEFRIPADMLATG